MSKIFTKIKSIEPEVKVSGRSLNLTPIMDDTPTPSVDSQPDEKFPNFLHQGSHLSAASAHDVHQPSPLVLPIAVAAAVIWIISVMAMYFGFFGNIGDAGGRLNAAQWISVLMLAFIPTVMIGVIAYALRQLSAMSSAATQLTRTARAFSQPNEAMIASAKGMSDAVDVELERIKSSFDETVGHVTSLEGLIRDEREKLEATSITVKGRFDTIGATLLDQHKALDGLANIFDQRMEKLAKLLDGHSKDIDANSQLTDQKLEEARTSLNSAIGNLNETSEKVRTSALGATSSLNVGHKEIEDLGEKLQERSDQLAENYKTQTKELSSLLASLRDEQDNLSGSLDERLIKMREMSLSAQVGTENLTEASEASRKTVQALAEAANLTNKAIKQRFTEMEVMLRYSNEQAESISDKASNRVQSSLAHTRREIARIEADMIALQEKLQHPQSLTQGRNIDRPEVKQSPERRPLAFKPLDDELTPIDPLSDESAILTDFTALDTHSPEDHDLDLVIEPPSDPLDLQSPDPDAEITNFDAGTLRPAAVPALRGRSKPERRGRWGWRDILPSIDSGTDANDGPTPLEPAPTNVSDDAIVQSLSDLGLTPGAIVDDGCIIEACNARKATGDLAMSQVVANRLGDPVRHLYRKMEENPNLKSNARAYTTQYKIGIEIIENDREAIRVRLESDAGRAFLLCDAALNG